jgi:hypothetical protein
MKAKTDISMLSKIGVTQSWPTDRGDIGMTAFGPKTECL